MFSRLKQKVKEKTGRSKATVLPAEIDEALIYFKSLKPRVQDLYKHMANLNDVANWQVKANFSGPLENYALLGDRINVQPFINCVDTRMEAEVESMDKVLAICERYKAFTQNESKLHTNTIANLNKTRLDMDSAANKYASNDTDVNRTRFDDATREFEVACDRMRELAISIQTIEETHSMWQDELMREIKAGMRKPN
ncbi:BAR domain-containing protein [Caenorhabditis elegans]|uniref:BAR domain-containing protein n=1 Tax=Caenorhabditis elegans TaxID=6239 RepID=Q7YWP8_CAEEL|nr:BAR domain-containing protein [Caenorhabditis elegans]CAE18009.1 BAR domain-containing protein [Caenorhabditis elegans]|eukprot:NP_001022878.1 Uncharacterized protein CELE_Y47D3A.31 [Caenorhabditis elegans]